MSRFLCIGASLLLCVACASTEPTVSSTLRSAQQSVASGNSYLGVWLGDAVEGGALVLATFAGPAALSGLKEGDRIVSINGAEVDSSSAYAIIRQTSPGDHLILNVIRDNAELTIDTAVATREDWAPPLSFPAAIPYAATDLAEQTDILADPVVQGAISERGEAIEISERLDRMFDSLVRSDKGFHKLPLIRNALMNPGAMYHWRDRLAETLRPFELARTAAVQPVCETLALRCLPGDLTLPSGASDALVDTIKISNEQVRTIFAAANIDRARTLNDMQYLLRTTARDHTLVDQPEALRGIRAMQASMKIDLAAMFAIANQILPIVDRLPDLSGEPKQPPAELSGIVEGDIIDYADIDGGYIVVGGIGANRYAMNRLYAVIDVAGDDVYDWGDATPLETQLVVDLAGNDQYRGRHAGPAAGWGGISVLLDRAGNDRYESEVGGCGAGVLGFGFLFDDAGSDVYECAAWSVASAVYGAGVLVDAGEDADVFDSQIFSQGVGGPRGMGILVDAGGNDLYRANGPVPSDYGTPASYLAFSQGVGTGIRPYDTGGVGVLLDYGGDDRYEGGEFAQGGGYLWGIGLLRDEAGNDLYYGNRFAQGFSAHQAFGMLTDGSGDDIYWAMGAAAQGAAWDQSIAVLDDAEGDDIYRAQSLGQGAAAQQSRALLRDGAGNDVYWSSSRETQGAAGDNSYHFSQRHPLYSLGILVDEDGDDRYSTGVENGTTLLRQDKSRDNGGGVAGLVIDRQ